MRRVRTLLILAVTSAVLSGCNAGNPPPEDTEGDYVSQVLVARAALDEAYRNQPDKPIPPEKMKDFLPLKYFPPDPDYVVPAALKPATEKQTLPLEFDPVLQGQERAHLHLGLAGRFQARFTVVPVR